MRLSVVSGPATEPVTLDEAKVQCKVEVDDDDDFFNDDLIVTAREYVERYTGRALITRTYDATFAPASTLQLRMLPVASLTSITATLTDDTTETVATTEYKLDPVEFLPIVKLDSYPSGTEYLTVRYVAGYGDASDVPASFKRAMLLLIRQWYDNRTAAAERAQTELPFSVKALLNPYRVSWGL